MIISQILNYIRPNYKKTYSQMGEDLIVKNYFSSIKNFSPSYIDIGAFDPFSLSNTALLYESGSRGINIEPNPLQYKRFLKHRSKDTNLNIGIGPKEGKLDYYRMSSPVLNTFSKEQAEECEQKWGIKILDIIPIDVKPFTWVFQNYFNGKFPDFLSMDIEGLEDKLIDEMKTFPSLPAVICIETLSFAMDTSGTKKDSLLNTLVGLNYKIYADTHLNTILVNAHHRG